MDRNGVEDLLPQLQLGPDLFLQLLPFGDVLEETVDVQRLSAGRKDAPVVEVHVDGGSVPPEEDRLPLQPPVRIGEEMVHHPFPGFRFGVVDRCRCPVDFIHENGRGRETENPGVVDVGREVFPVEGDPVHADGGVLHQFDVPVFQLEETLLLFFFQGDVPFTLEDSAYCSGLVFYRYSAGEENFSVGNDDSFPGFTGDEGFPDGAAGARGVR